MEQFMKLPPGQKAGVLLGVVALLGLLMYYMMVVPEQERGEKARKDLTKVERDLTALRSEASPEEDTRLQKLKEQLIEQDKEHRKMMPLTDDVSKFISTLKSDADKLQLTVQKTQPLPRETMDNYNVTPVYTVVEGRMPALLAWMRLYAGPERRIMHIRDLRLERIVPDQAVLKDKLRRREAPTGGAGGTVSVQTKTPEEEMLDNIALAGEARLSSMVRATFYAAALTWTGKPLVKNENAPSAAKKKRKRT